MKKNKQKKEFLFASLLILAMGVVELLMESVEGGIIIISLGALATVSAMSL